MNNWNALLFREIAVHLGVSPWQIYRVMRQAGIARQHGSEQNYATYKTKPKFSVKRSLTPEEEQLRVTGVMLYRAEGVKTGNVVDFVNSDPLLIKLFMAFLRRVCGIAESRLRILLYCYADQDIEELKQYWIYITCAHPVFR